MFLKQLITTIDKSHLAQGVAMVGFVSSFLLFAREVESYFWVSSAVASWVLSTLASFLIYIFYPSPKNISALLVFLPSALLWAAPVASPFRGSLFLLLWTPALYPMIWGKVRSAVYRCLFLGCAISLAAFSLLATPEGYLWVHTLFGNSEFGPDQLIASPFLLVGLIVGLGASSRSSRRWSIAFLVIWTMLVAAQIFHRSWLVGLSSLGALLLFWSFGNWEEKITGPIGGRQFLLCAIVAGILGLTPFWLRSDPPPSPSTPPRIAFLPAQSMVLDLPSSDWRDRSWEPQFGYWKKLLEESGSTVSTLQGGLSLEAFENLDLLVLVNNNRDWKESELQAVWGYVERGGSLLVLADHTDIDGQMKPTNKLLSPYGIEILFDSAIPQDSEWSWVGCMRQLAHPIAYGRLRPESYRISVGASLGISLSAKPILIGRHAFSDLGDHKNKRAFLGDMRWNPGERLGGLVLAAEARAGKGRVLVFGDTSSFQDASIPSSLPFVGRVVSWLTRVKEDAFPWWQIFLSIAVLLVSFGLACAKRSIECFGAILLLSSTCAQGFSQDQSQSQFEFPSEKIAWIDLSHGTTAKTRGSGDQTIDGFLKGLLRFGLYPLFFREDLVSSLDQGGRLLVIQSPRSDYSKAELAAMDLFLARGGEIWILGGYYEAQSCPQLFKHFEIDVPKTPLGDTKEAVMEDGAGVSVKEVWPVSLQGAVRIAKAWDYPLIVQKQVSKGRLVVIGDPEIFLGRGLDDKGKINPKNAAAFEKILGNLGQQK